MVTNFNIITTHSLTADLIPLLRKESLLYYTDFPLYTAETATNLEVWFLDPKRHTWCLYKESTLAGFVSAHLVPKHTTASITLVVDEPFQRKGIGTVLLQHAISSLQHEGYVRIEAQICTENTASVQLLESQGFKKEGVLYKNFMIGGKLRDSYMLARIEPTL